MKPEQIPDQKPGETATKSKKPRRRNNKKVKPQEQTTENPEEQKESNPAEPKQEEAESKPEQAPVKKTRRSNRKPKTTNPPQPAAPNTNPEPTTTQPNPEPATLRPKRRQQRRIPRRVRSDKQNQAGQRYRRDGMVEEARRRTFDKLGTVDAALVRDEDIDWKKDYRYVNFTRRYSISETMKNPNETDATRHAQMTNLSSTRHHRNINRNNVRQGELPDFVQLIEDLKSDQSQLLSIRVSRRCGGE